MVPANRYMRVQRCWVVKKRDEDIRRHSRALRTGDITHRRTVFTSDFRRSTPDLDPGTASGPGFVTRAAPRKVVR